MKPKNLEVKLSLGIFHMVEQKLVVLKGNPFYKLKGDGLQFTFSCILR
jgi:hypothetical protein